jgi:hypothetical protein
VVEPSCFMHTYLQEFVLVLLFLKPLANHKKDTNI